MDPNTAQQTQLCIYYCRDGYVHCNIASYACNTAFYAINNALYAFMCLMYPILLCSDDELFRRAHKCAFMGDFVTLTPGQQLSSNIIDAWCCILNHRDNLRSPGSPCRFFASIPTTVCVPYGLSSIFCDFVFVFNILNLINVLFFS